MEPKTDQKRHAGEDKRQRDKAGHWRGEEVKALLSCGGRDKPGKRKKAGPSTRPSQAV